MHFRSILGGGLALLVISSAPAAIAQEPEGSFIGNMLPGVFGSSRKEQPVVLAQAGDPRITQLEEQIRALSGTIEELNFQILQMQEQMRKMQEDNEFRFQELEQGKKKSDAGDTVPATDSDTAATAEQPAADQPAGEVLTAPKEARAGAGPAVSEEVPMDENGEPITTGEPPKTFGTITFDASGNVNGTSADPAAGADGTVVAALPATDDPEELYRNSYQFILSGDYGTAESGFREHVSRFPADPRTADAHFWLGESLLGQQKYRDAAEVFLSANRDFPTSKKAPDMLLKLGVSLAGLNQRDVACATFAEVGKRYPDASGQLKQRVKQEQALAAC